MSSHLKGLNPKYFKYISLFCIILVISLFLPYIWIKGEGISISGIQLIRAALQQEDLLNVLLLALPTLLTLVSTVVLFFLPRKYTVTYTIIAFMLSALSALIILFTIKKTIDGSQLLSVKFLIKYLGIGYWIFMFVSFIGLASAMKSAKVNPGYIVLTLLAVFWILPIAWVIMTSFRQETGSYTSYFIPKHFTLNNYKVLLTDTSQFQFVKWYGNTLFVATCTCVLSTIIVLSTAFTLSRLRFKGRRAFMNVALILGMFPGFMSMIAVYYILKGLGFTQSLIALIMVYSGGASLGYYIVKGYFDTIPKAIDEAACIDGASKWDVFTKITIPLSKPVIIYTILISFISPWGDFIFARVIMGDNYDNYTVALGLFTMLQRANIATWYTRFAAGAVLVSIPIAILFICFQRYYIEGMSGSVKG